MQKAIRESLYMEQYLCDTHTLQLAVRATFEAVAGMKRLLAKTKDLAKMSHQSTSVANQQLKNQCKQMGIKYLKLKNPCETRWNSQEMNMSSVLLLKPALQVLFTEDDGNIWAQFALSASEWRSLASTMMTLRMSLRQRRRSSNVFFVLSTNNYITTFVVVVVFDKM